MPIFKVILKWLVGISFILAGINHFFNTEFYLKIMPAYFCCHLQLIYLSGIFEVILGTLFLIPRFSRLAAWGLIALLIAVFPANLFMAMNTGLFPEYSPALIWLRLPMQFLLIFWLFQYTKISAEKISK